MRIRPIEEQCLSELIGTEGASLGESPIGQRIAEASRVPLNEMSDWDLAFLLRQRHGAQYLAPLAFARLDNDVWFDAGLYRGDLLLALLRNQGRLGHREDLEGKLEEYLERARNTFDVLDPIDRDAAIRSFGPEGFALE